MTRRVYFIRPIGMAGPVKIGCSKGPDGRRRTLETWSPFPLEIIAEVEGGFDLERRFHALFMETHQNREWFGWSRRLAATVASINDGTFDASVLPAPIHAPGNFRRGKGSRANEWTPIRRFSVALSARYQALRKRGMPFEEWTTPHFSAYAYGDGQYANRHKKYPDLEAHVRACEAAAAEMTTKWGSPTMKPVLWEGAFPDEAKVAAA